MSAGAGPNPPGRLPPWPTVSQNPDLPSLESAILDFWSEDETFRASVEARPAGPNEYVFYDGPPFANGLPHYGSLITGFVKDAIPRFQTMRGRRVERRFGWDCHGLPAEMAAEKELGLSGRAAINAYGVGAFNAYCRSLVQRTTAQWHHYVTRQARWVDFDDDYKTMDLTYMESVMWAFKQAYDHGLAYQGYRVLPYCWECETPLSNFETRQDDSYRERTDPAVTVGFELEPASPEIESLPPALRAHLRLLVWTTTPWTLPSNLALAVGPEIEYAVYDTSPHPTVVSRALAEQYAASLPETPVAVIKGSTLIGRRYRPLFPFFAQEPGAFVVLGANFVSTDEGTGVVHLAPGFGEDDQRTCEAAGIGVVCPVDDTGRFTAEVGPYAGTQVFDANPLVIADLAAAGALVGEEAYTHSYPHCWRTDTPLIYKAVTSWFVQVSTIRDRMVELNKTITWIPEHVRDGAFGKWLEGARDWSISRNRFWGAPIPVWISDDPAWPRIDVYGSLDEIEADFGVRPADLHRPFIDELVRSNPNDPTGTSMMRRVPDVLDCWFESGSMPFAQLHYPFERRERFESHFPADFIVEYIGQTRGWFYTLHVLSTLLFDCPPFTTCMAHGIVLGDDGRKMSKHLGNFPDIDEVFDVEGADAMRWALLSSSLLRGGDLIVERPMFAAAVKEVILPLWSTWYFLALYGNVDGIRGRWRADAQGVLDRYILAKLAVLVESVTDRLDAYDPAGACAAIVVFLDALTNWYVRRSRDRFWRAVLLGDTDKADAYDTLSTVMEVLCRVAAPLLPLVSETVWKGLTGGRSVHLCDWPDLSCLPADLDLVADMDRVREVCSAAHSIRKAAHLRTRLPLATLTVAASWAARLAPFVSLIAEETNVKEVVLAEDVAELAELVLVIVPAAVGPRLGPETQDVIRAAKRGEWSVGSEGSVMVAGQWVLGGGEFTLDLRPRDSTACRGLPGNDAVVSLELTTTPALEAEGLARDVVRKVAEARRAAGLHIADRIELVLEVAGGCESEVGIAVTVHREWVMDQTLATSLTIVDVGEGPSWSVAETGSSDLVVHLHKAQ